MARPNLLAIVHVDDRNNDAIELKVTQGGADVDLSGTVITARYVMGKTNILVKDNVLCSRNEDGNIIVPFDNAVIETRAGDMKIEVNIVNSDGELTLQFPLWVRVNASILDTAEIDEHSQGRIPDLLKEVEELLKNAATTDQVYEILNSTLQGDPSIAPSLYVVANQSGSYSLVYMDSDDVEHVIFDFSNLPSGSSDYEDLENKPQIVVANSPTGWWETLTFNGKFKFKPFYFSNGQDPNGKNEIILDIKDNAITFNMLRDNNKFFYDYGLYSNPPSDLFTNWYTAPYANGIWYIANTTLQGLPVAKTGTLINYYISGDGRKLQLYIVDVDSSTMGHSQIFFRVSYMGNLGTWQEITNQNVVSGVVNSDGTITFTNSDGTTFTTTGSSVIGADGFSPTATVTQTQSGATVTITDKNGTTTANISNGDDYVLTNQDKTDIANIVLQLLPTTTGVLYGNTSN